MARVMGDPEELFKFAHALSTFCENTRSGLQGLRSQIDALGSSSWNDQKQKQFSEAFGDVASKMLQIMQDIEPPMVQRLEKLASLLEEYERT